MIRRSSENRIFRFSDDLFISLTDTEPFFCFGGGKRELWYIAGNLTFDTAAYLASSIPFSPVIPAQAGIQSYPHGNLSGKKVSSIPHPGFPPARE